MRQEFLNRLHSRNRGERMQAWSELHLEPKASQSVLSRADRMQLAEILSDEEDDGVYRQGADVLRGFSCGFCGEENRRENTLSPAAHKDSLDEWLWTEFHKPSAMFRSSGQGHSRRDADAVEVLARRLGFKEFPLVNFHPLPLRADGWREITTEQAYKTIGLVGRLSLFGKRAVTDLQNDQARFRFPRQTPLPSREAKDELRLYHCLHECNGEQIINEYYSEVIDGTLTDYGIVQHYPCFLGTHWITVVICCGTSSLGTLGAAHWAALDLGLPQDPSTGAPITLPKTIGSDSRLEALIRTTSVSQTHISRPSTIELLDLYVDHYRWSPTDHRWYDIQQHEIELGVRNGEPVSLKIDGEMTKMKTGSQNFRLATQVVLRISRSRNHSVDVEKLARDRAIWNGRELFVTKVKQRLHNVNRQALKGTLTIDQRVKINAAITISKD